jgi:hypothetical protein
VNRCACRCESVLCLGLLAATIEPPVGMGEAKAKAEGLAAGVYELTVSTQELTVDMDNGTVITEEPIVDMSEVIVIIDPADMGEAKAIIGQYPDIDGAEVNTRM